MCWTWSKTFQNYHILLQCVNFTLADNACSWLKMDLNMIRGHHLLSAMEGLQQKYPGQLAYINYAYNAFRMHKQSLSESEPLARSNK